MSAADPNDGDNWFNRFFRGHGPGQKSSRKHAPPTTSELTEETQTHLRRVYLNLSLASVAASLASYFYMNRLLPDPGLLFVVLLLGSMLGIQFLPNTASNAVARHGLLYGFGFANGWGVGPLLRQAFYLDPGIAFSALVGAAVIFLSFSLTALMTSRRSQLYLGGYLAAGASALLWLGFLNTFLASGRLFSAELYLGLLVFAGYVLFDTQLIVERSEEGYRDPPGDALALFTNLVAIFVRLLVLLSRDRREGRRDRRDSKDD